ncbi:MAG: thioredoxin family protein [Bacteroidia bacterium]|jgi:small redox-active disulfide protein 2|nr:thioredoxin family protein [Bacteroidia bacterium]
MEIKILGTGCAKCKTTQQIVEKVVADNGVDAQISKVEDIMDIMNYNVIATPAVVVDGVVKIKGRVPSESEVKQALGL